MASSNTANERLVRIITFYEERAYDSESHVPALLAIELRARNFGPNFHIENGPRRPQATAMNPRRLPPHPYPSAAYI